MPRPGGSGFSALRLPSCPAGDPSHRQGSSLLRYRICSPVAPSLLTLQRALFCINNSGRVDSLRIRRSPIRSIRSRDVSLPSLRPSSWLLSTPFPDREERGRSPQEHFQLQGSLWLFSGERCYPPHPLRRTGPPS